MTRTQGTESTISEESIAMLVEEHRGWAESIARSVARAWSMDWREDGLDGAALEALLFCARRYDPLRGVPFRGYARKRIHEASSDEARRSKSWKTGRAGNVQPNEKAREISARLLDVFPELREGQLAIEESESTAADGGLRGAVRSLLVGASILAVQSDLAHAQPDDIMDYKKMIELLADLEPIHQAIIWKTYWEGISLRGVADEWSTDELNVMREHKILVQHLLKGMMKNKRLEPPKVRPGLRPVALKNKRELAPGQFSIIIKGRI